MARTPALLLAALLLLSPGSRADSATEAYARARAAYDAGDYAGAVEHWRRAADMGHAAAAFRLGAMHEEGTGVDQDIEQALEWYRRAAEHGSERAQFNLAHMYANGKGVARDEAEAAKWYRRSAERGNPHAQYALGLIQYRGEAVERDLVEAWAWLTVAVHNFGPGRFRDDAAEVRRRLGEEMTAGQREAAQRLLDEWAAARH